MPMPIKSLSKHKYKIIAFVYTLAVAYISLTPLDKYNLPDIDMGDKAVHLVLYLFLTLLWLMAYPELITIKKIYLGTIIAWGILIEFLQAFLVTGRSGDIFDALANTAGSILGLYIYIHFRTFFKVSK